MFKCTVTYDHRTLRTRLPVRSAIYKQCTGGLVVAWVTSSEYPLLYVFCISLVWVESDGAVDDFLANGAMLDPTHLVFLTPPLHPARG
jgi:hypothetical protein